MEAFNESEDYFDTHCFRVSLYFTANDINGEKKVHAFLTLVGPKIYGLAKNILSPKDPATCTYAEIVKALSNHYEAKEF